MICQYYRSTSGKTGKSHLVVKVVLPKIMIPDFNKYEDIFSPDLLAQSIVKVLQPEQIREIIGFLSEAVDEL